MNRFTITLAAAVTSLSLVAGSALASAPADSAAKASKGAKKRTPKLKGHYAGTNAGGLPISFDVAGSKTKPTVENFAVDVNTECWSDTDNDGESDTLVAHITGFGAKVKKDGSFDIYYAPDDDTEFEFNGVISKGKAKVDVIVGGTFDPDGTPSLVGALQCDSWGEAYNAKRD